MANFPEGVHVSAEQEFLNRFATGFVRRKWLRQKVGELLTLARASGKLECVFVWGSFVSAKESPNDVDILLVMSEDFRGEEVPQAGQKVFDYASARMRFQADVFWSSASIPEETLRLWLDTYQCGRDFKGRGIIEVRGV